jgi:threonylcarbamoyladenosine tRNA methylthiotransferase MtaB
MDHILDEVRRLSDNGYREIVLTGVHLGHYGVEGNWNKPRHEWTRLSHLLKRIAVLDGDFRIRLSSLEATEVTRELIDVIGEFTPKVCPHLHLCLQSGSDQILRRMRRRWSTRMFIDRCRQLRERLDHPALTTDVIVGFPGETDADFQKTCQTVEEIGFSKIHVFPFSARRGTPAAGMADQLPKSLKLQRCRHLAELEFQLRQAYWKSLIGRRLQVLLESPSDQRPDSVLGTSCRYAPAEMSGDDLDCGQLENVLVTSVDSDRVRGVRRWVEEGTRFRLFGSMEGTFAPNE